MPASLPVPDTGTARSWRPAALVQGSLALHAAAVLTVLWRPALWPWALAAVVADHLVLSAAGLLPRSRVLGRNLTRLPGAARQVALTIDDGPDPEVTPQVLALLETHQARATFFCIGERVRRYPELAREIVRRGHDIENHSEQHPWRFSLMGPAAMAREVARAQESIRSVTGRVARFFRAPAGLRNPFLDPVLARAGLTLASWTRRGFDTMNADPRVILARLTRGLKAGDILLLHDGNAARSPAGVPVILGVLPPLLEQLRAAQLTPVTLREALASQDTLNA
jgi:peptidoglycan/xylan/chitin deacetylase (PgdA/CDA1 family)